jgi:hypothetical protein
LSCRATPFASEFHFISFHFSSVHFISYTFFTHQKQLATHALEWRKVLVHGRVSVPLELTSGGGLHVPVGLLTVDLELLPSPPAPLAARGVLPVFVSQTAVVEQLNRERVLRAGVERRFQ